jgi:type I restriction-modification system DNA methylase subunit
MSAQKDVAGLIEKFERNADSYHSSGYNETQVRQEFINPLFKALGWDIYNDSGYAEAYKDVIHEDAIRVGGATKAPDYCFRIGGVRKFFLEAKKPSVNIKTDVGPAYQLRRYAWSAKLPVSVLTDFEEFAVYDCTARPGLSDKPEKSRIFYCTYKDYLEKWDQIAGIFSKDAVLKGSFDKFAAAGKGKRGTSTVDSEFLTEIERWRDALARNIAGRNAALSIYDLNFAVQRTIDRILFLRMCEDRGIEPYGQLLGITNGAKIYERLCGIFEQADDKYNSGLFHFRREKERAEGPDELTPRLIIDDKVLRDIIRNLYYPESPYEFSVLPAEILGNVYEQFLGKVIRLTAGHHAVVEEKPEVKKAGGVYYTPSYIVDYIVANTVGKLCGGGMAQRGTGFQPVNENKNHGQDGHATFKLTPREISRLRIVDPACGSGSFLLGAYTYLLRYVRDWYVNDGPEKHKKEIYQGRGGQWYLTISEKKRILLANIFGVDIDPSAVEVTKLSLLLKVLENENQETLGRQYLMIRERALPDLESNIKCGNSLIGPDFYDNAQLDLFDEDQRRKINVFDWKKEFPAIFKQGGFDAVIGNPPYVRIQTLQATQSDAVDYYGKHFVSASKGNYDIYVVFVERGAEVLNKDGRLGFILPSKFFSTDYGSSLRKYVSSEHILNRIVDFGHEQVFENATTYTCLLFLSKKRSDKVDYLSVSPLELNASKNVVEIDSKSFNETPWFFASGQTNRLLEKINKCSLPLLELPAMMSRGSSTGADEVFCLESCDGYFKTREDKKIEVEDGILRKPLYATDFTRFNFRARNSERIIFPYSVESGKYALIDESDLKKRFPKAYAYLHANKHRLENRKQFQQWYGYSAPRNLNVHDKADLLVPLLADRGLFSPVSEQAASFCMMASAGFSVSILPECPMQSRYILGLVNSRLLFWLLRRISNKFRGGWITCTKQYFGTLPIHKINFSKSQEKCQHDKMVSLVDRMLDLHKRLGAVKVPGEKTRIQREIDSTDSQIDRLVYELYGLTEEEISIVEGG